MPTCIQPSQLSPGHLFLDYLHITQAVAHKCSVRFLAHVDIYDIPGRTIDANNLAALVANCLPIQVRIHGWGIRDNNGATLYSAPFASSYLGSHPVAAGMQDAVSSTVTFTGKGIPGTVGLCSGPTRLVLHTANAFLFTPKSKSIPSGTDADLDALATFLLSHSDLWADYFGQGAGVNGKYTVQYNAHDQRKNGT